MSTCDCGSRLRELVPTICQSFSELGRVLLETLDGHLADIQRPLHTSKVYCRLHNSPPQFVILSQMRPLLTRTIYFVRYIIIL
jgi:hypothetical protein